MESKEAPILFRILMCNRQEEATRSLIKIVNYVGSKYLSHADWAKIKDCIERGADPDCRVGEFNESLLSYVIACSNRDMFDFLIEKDVDVDPWGPGLTPLHYAVQLRNGSDKSYILETLLELKADVNCEVSCGTPLSLAVSAGDVGLIKFLVKHDADPNTSTSRSYLSLAIENSHFESTKLCCDLGASLKDDDDTAFHTAVGRSRRFIKALITRAHTNSPKEILDQREYRRGMREKIITAFWVLKELGISEDVKCLILSRLFVDDVQCTNQGLSKQVLRVGYKYPDVLAQVDKRVTLVQRTLQIEDLQKNTPLDLLSAKRYYLEYKNEVQALLSGNQLEYDLGEFKEKFPDILSVSDNNLVGQMCHNYEKLLDDDEEADDE